MKKATAILVVMVLGLVGLTGCNNNTPEGQRNAKEIAECRANPTKSGCPNISN
jgi:hypothetical protein